jgi:ketosteroid isomerase-like protein
MSNQDIFIKANTALAEGNYEKFMMYCAEDVKWDNVGGLTFKGKDELFGYIQSAYNGISFTTEDHIKENDYVVEFGQIVFEKNGESKTSRYCDIWNFKDGMISQVTSFVI